MRTDFFIFKGSSSIVLALFTMAFFGLCGHRMMGGTKYPTKTDLLKKLSSQKYVFFVSIFCLFLCLVYVTCFKYDVISMTNPGQLVHDHPYNVKHDLTGFFSHGYKKCGEKCNSSNNFVTNQPFAITSATARNYYVF